MNLSLRPILVTLIVASSCTSSRAQTGSSEPLSHLLSEVNGAMRIAVRQYDGTTVASELTLSPQQGKGTGKAIPWRIRVLAQNIPGEAGTADVEVQCTRTGDTARATALAVSFNFKKWSRDNYVLVPAIVYNGNRHRAIGNGYAPPYPKDMYYNPSVPLTISNNPRLAINSGQASLIELQTGNAATPAMCFFSPRLKKGFILLTDQATRFGNSGLSIAENAAKDHCAFEVSAPAMRKMAPGFGDFHPSGDKAPDWQPGDTLSIRMRVIAFDAKDIPALLEKFIRVRKEQSGPNHPRNLLPMSEQFALGTAICKSRWSENPVGNYYQPENSKDFQLGWVSGMINTFPMLALNDPKERQRVSEELDFVVGKLQGESGYFYGGITADGRLRPERMHPDFPEVQAMVRKNSDALLWMMKHLILLRAQGYGDAIKPSWEEAARKLALAFTHTWEKDHQFGQYVAPRTGEIAVYNSTAGAIAPAGLALASQYFKEPRFLQAAQASARYYYNRDVVRQGLTGGDCGDISQDANSESAFGFLESLMALYYATGDRKWVQKAEVEAALCATWTLSYDPVFPAASAIAKLDCHMAGAVFASIQNKHAAPGICEASGDYLFKLFRATGNPLYADLVRDIQHANAEAVNRPGHLTTHNLIGSSMERIQPSDAEGRGSTGNFINTRNSWTETNGVLMALELPGIYVRTDTRKIQVFDHITVTTIKSDSAGMDLVLENRTAYDAQVSVLAESDRQSVIPMGYAEFLHWPHVPVKAGGSVTIHIAASGKLAEYSASRVQYVSLSASPAPQTIEPYFGQRTEGPGNIRITIDNDHPGQVMDGLGGAFNELGWSALSSLPEKDRKQVMRDLFDTANGVGLRFNRIPIGASDFALSAYSLDDSVGDWGLEHFSVARDEACLIPYIKAAQACNTNMKFHASPWSPPGWMKTNGKQTGGGELLSDDRTLNTLADYLAKFLEAYKARGIQVNRLCPQNEPLVSGSYPGCKISAPLYGRLVRDHILPALAQKRLGTEVWAGTLNYWRPETRAHFDGILSDSALIGQVAGISFQYSNMKWVSEFRAKYPGKPMQFSESECYNGKNSLEEVLRDFQDFAAYTRAGASLFTFWNMVLPEPHRSTWGWSQNSLVVIDSAKHTVTFEPDYALARLLGANLNCGDRYIPARIVRGDSLVGSLDFKPKDAVNFMETGLDNGAQVVAFKKMDGSFVIFLYNGGEAVQADVCIRTRTVRAYLPGHALVAIEVAAPGS